MDGAAYLSSLGSSSFEPLTIQLTSLWERVFGDGPVYTTEFFQTCFRPEDVLLWVEEDEIRSMLFLLPAFIRTAEGELVKGRCLFAGATYPEHRGKGYFRKLFHEADVRIEERGEWFAAMHPAVYSLYDFYRTLGYETAFTCAEITLPSWMSDTEDTVQLISEDRFVSLYGSLSISREKTLLWGDEVLPFLYRDAVMDHGGAFAVEHNGATAACGIYCQPDENTILIKDIAGADPADVFPSLRKMWKPHTILLRIPQKMAENWDIGAVSKPFGMIKYRKEPFDGGALLRDPGFMGAVLD